MCKTQGLIKHFWLDRPPVCYARQPVVLAGAAWTQGALSRLSPTGKVGLGEVNGQLVDVVNPDSPLPHLASHFCRTKELPSGGKEKK